MLWDCWKSERVRRITYEAGSGKKCEAKRVATGVFMISSTHRPEPHVVHMTLPSCSCRHFRRTKFPCRHIFMLVDEGHVTWEDLPQEYRSIPFFTLNTGDQLRQCATWPIWLYIGTGMYTEEMHWLLWLRCWQRLKISSLVLMERRYLGRRGMST